ncbi:hypothetical protein BUALT_Bualt19G0104600 [Buddleja alternifolia]|uniref:Transcriptional regulator of RNA polII, SAGA, subunit n=1 Tax=Buddleja alternifolia TaxID=168488 RepID=A0AAV6WBB8_9LAMI|nr:hypothetical protein BUALT_Bualt19G0104600 [Buddleja alternifolia]
MMGSHHFTRIDILELKDLIYQKIGQQRAEKYFDHLKRFLSSKLSKADFDRICIQTVGRENISLHNRLIRAILQNASQAKNPPQKSQKVGLKVTNGYQRNCLQSLYGDAFPQSPRKCRSPINRDRKARDRPSPLGPLGKSPSITIEETVRTQEHPSASGLHSHWEDGEEVEQFARSPSLPIKAPFGVSLKMGSTQKKSLHSVSNFSETCQNSGELPNTRTLRSRLEKKLAMEGIGISMDGVNVINNSLDVFLKKLIEPCLGISGSRCMDQTVNGFNRTYASMLDFQVAMESNPRLLGEDWSTQLEKICHYDIP